MNRHNLMAALQAFVFLLVLSSTPSFSQPSGIGMGMRLWRGEARCWKASDLNLSQEQAKALDAFQQAFSRETQIFRAQIFAKRIELREFLTDPNSKIEIIRSKSSEILDHQAKLEDKSVEYLIKVRSLLTQEQLKVWCPELEIPPFRRMTQGPDFMGPMPFRRPPFHEGAKPE